MADKCPKCGTRKCARTVLGDTEMFMCGTYVDKDLILVESEGCKTNQQRKERCKKGFTKDELRDVMCAAVRDHHTEQRAKQLGQGDTDA